MRRPLPLTWPSSAIGALPSVSGALVASFFIARGQVLPDRLPDRLTPPQSILDGSESLKTAARWWPRGAIVFAKACELGLEGIVSKRAGSRYRSGNCRQWLKSKNPAFMRE